MKPDKTIGTEQGARAYAIDWQLWQANEAMSWSEVLEWQAYFEWLGEKFNLTDEFKENGII